MSELPPRTPAELREWEQSLDPGGLDGFVARTSRTAQRLAAGEELIFETRAEEEAREFKQWEMERKNLLSADDVRKIRKLREEGMTYVDIGKMFGRSDQTIRVIALGDRYKAVK